MRSLITLEFILITSCLVFLECSSGLYPQRTSQSNSPDRKQLNQAEHDKGNDRKRNDNEEDKKENTEERKDHTGINIKRPDRDDISPKNTSESNDRKERTNDPVINEEISDPVIEIDLVPVPFIIPIIDVVPDPPRRPAIYELPKYDPANSGLHKLEELDYTGALQDFNLAIKRDPGSYKLYYYRGLAYLNLQLYSESIEDFDHFLIFYFYDMDGYFHRGLAKFYLQQKFGAYGDFSIAAEMGHKIAASIIKRYY